MKLDYRLLGLSGAHGAAGGGSGRSSLFCSANLPEKHTINRRLLKYQTVQHTAKSFAKGVNGKTNRENEGLLTLAP